MNKLAEALAAIDIKEEGAVREYAEVMFYNGAMAAVKILGAASGNGDPIAVSRTACELVDELDAYFNMEKEDQGSCGKKIPQREQG